MHKHTALYKHDRALHPGEGAILTGVDEVGRGPLAGPVVAAAVCLDLARPIAGINDSKKLSASQREELYGHITESAHAWAVGEASVEEIEALNILQASLLAMERAIAGTGLAPALILIDGPWKLPRLTSVSQMPIVKGDGLSASIAAASIVAKVTRDRMMTALAQQYSHYEFEAHKGYGTERHRELIETHGLCAIHRKSFCKNIVAA